MASATFDPCGEFVINDDVIGQTYAETEPEQETPGVSTYPNIQAVIQAHPDKPGHVQIGVAPAELTEEECLSGLLAALTMSDEQFAQFIAHGQEHLATV